VEILRTPVIEGRRRTDARFSHSSHISLNTQPRVDVNIADKYWICRLKYRRWRFNAWYKRERAKLVDMKTPDDEVRALDADTQLTLGQIQDEIDCISPGLPTIRPE
jgi:hypothetical protein